MRGVPRPRRAMARIAGVVDADAEDDRRALDDRGQLVVGVEVEPVGRPEPVAQRAADPAGAGRGADDRERLEAEPERPRGRSLADHDVERVVLHRRVEDLLDRAVEPMDLVDEQDVALLERGQDRGEVAGPLDGGSRGVLDVHAELARDDRREGRLAETGRAVQEDVVGRLSPALRRGQQHRQVGLDLALADVLVERARPQGAFHDEVALVLEVRREDARQVVGHRSQSSMHERQTARMFDAGARARRMPTQRLGIRVYDTAMRLSRRSEYGLRALVDLVHHQGDGPIALAALAERNRLPTKFLEQIMATLKHAGIVRTTLGRARRLRARGGPDGRLGRPGHPPARWRAGAARLRLAPLLRAVLVRRRGDLPAARRDDRRPRRDARDPRQGDAGRAGRPARAGRDRSARPACRRTGGPPSLKGRKGSVAGGRRQLKGRPAGGCTGCSMWAGWRRP